jgi:flavin reductase (DIM6/NTAB) family NADH-FMN oxidoreductase RutF
MTSQVPQPHLDERQLNGVLDRLNTTGCIVTTAFAGGRDGCYVSYIAPSSMDPPRLMVLTSHVNLTHDLIQTCGILAVHPVARGQEAWIEHFGRQTGRDVDKFADIAWHPGVTGAPILDQAIGYVEGRVIDSMVCGDHTARLVEPIVASLRDPSAVPLTIFELFARGLVVPNGHLGNPWPAFAGAKSS